VLDELHAALLGLDAVQAVAGRLPPGHRRRLQLDALLAAMSDPVLAVDPSGHVLLANPTLVSLIGREPAGEPLSRLFAEPDLGQTLIAKGFRLPMCEVEFQAQALLLEATPISGGADGLVAAC
jgi:transcriptional regulator of aromatic amino acid metabolism